MDFYTYLWLRADGTPYYVGKGAGQRAFVNYGRRIYRPKDDARIVIQCWSNETEAFEMERFYIKLFGRKDNGTGILRNMTDGGEGLSGFKFSEDQLKKLSESHRGQHSSPATEIKLGQKLSPETQFKNGHSTWNKGKQTGSMSEESKRKKSVALKGKPWSAARRAAA